MQHERFALYIKAISSQWVVLNTEMIYQKLFFLAQWPYKKILMTFKENMILHSFLRAKVIISKYGYV